EELRRAAEAAWRGGSADLLIRVDAERASREARLTALELALSVVEAETGLFLLVGASEGTEPRSTPR
ncbi:MAG TPA: hypothetical protein VK458_23270, partial [Myxococcaceae bacterium]|nr:hypothetical protein [Myxococcaceae bacterium]